MVNSRREHTAILLTGTNEGTLKENLEFALKQIGLYGKIEIVSEIYGSEAWGFSSQDFQNQAIKLLTSLSPQELIQITQKIEIEAGRKPKMSNDYEARILDIDIIFYDNEILNSSELTIPHPHMQKRRFVLEPLNEIIPEFVHPTLQKSVQSLLNECPDKGKVWKID